jgi:hypothetical protein
VVVVNWWRWYMERRRLEVHDKVGDSAFGVSWTHGAVQCPQIPNMQFLFHRTRPARHHLWKKEHPGPTSCYICIWASQQYFPVQ